MFPIQRFSSYSSDGTHNINKWQSEMKVDQTHPVMRKRLTIKVSLVHLSHLILFCTFVCLKLSFEVDSSGKCPARPEGPEEASTPAAGRLPALRPQTRPPPGASWPRSWVAPPGAPGGPRTTHLRRTDVDKSLV